VCVLCGVFDWAAVSPHDQLEIVMKFTSLSRPWAFDAALNDETNISVVDELNDAELLAPIDGIDTDDERPVDESVDEGAVEDDQDEAEDDDAQEKLR
jgi:hypothetical protein